MKQGKRKKAVAASQTSAADMATDIQELPDAAYVDYLLSASEPSANEFSANDSIDSESTVVIEAAIAEAHEPTDETQINETQGDAAQTDETVLVLPTQCMLRDAVEYRQDLLNCLQAKSVAIDASAVTRIDTAFMQVLLAFARSRAADSQPIAWVNVSAGFVEAAQLLGLQSLLNVPVSAAA
ncbi:MAG: STAS domain-containing protein [Steroidobacteraceae bacterium]